MVMGGWTETILVTQICVNGDQFLCVLMLGGDGTGGKVECEEGGRGVRVA